MSVVFDEETLDESIEKGFTAGFIVHCDDLDTYRKLLLILDKFMGAKLVVSRIYNGRLYITKEVPKDFIEDVNSERWNKR
jgi:hypothetical protein